MRVASPAQVAGGVQKPRPSRSLSRLIRTLFGVPTASLDLTKATLGQRAEQLGLRAVRTATIPLRRRYSSDQGRWTRALDKTPRALRSRLGLDDRSAVGSRKIELGGGPHPLSGYLHVDADWHSSHLEAIAGAADLPFPDDFAEEIVAIHLLEHVHPTAVAATLAEWRRVLRPGGVLQVHVPDFKALSSKFLQASGDEKWKFMSAILGMYSGAEVAGPKEVVSLPDHKLLLDWPTLGAGFDPVEDVSAFVRDRHTNGWSPVMEQISLVARAINPA